MYNKNTAYDLSLFDVRVKKKKNVVKLNVKKLRKLRILKAKIALIVSAVAVCASVGFGVIAFISGQAQLTELTARDADLAKQIQESESLYIQLSVKKKSQVLDESMISRLKSEFNMIENKKPEYISVVSADSAELAEEYGEFIQLKGKFCKFCNNLFSV